MQIKGRTRDKDDNAYMQKRRSVKERRRVFGWATRIRTRNKGTKNPCVAITPWPNEAPRKLSAETSSLKHGNFMCKILVL